MCIQAILLIYIIHIYNIVLIYYKKVSVTINMQEEENSLIFNLLIKKLCSFACIQDAKKVL